MKLLKTVETSLYPNTSERLPGGFLDLVEQLEGIDPSDVIVARDALAREMAAHPEVHLPQQFEELMMLYQNRCDSQHYSFTSTAIQTTDFISRTPDCTHIEEAYSKVEKFTPINRYWTSTSYMVKVVRVETPSYLVSYDGQSRATVQIWSDREDSWQHVSADEQLAVLTDFFYESLRATAIQLGRTPEQQAVADADAKQMVEARYYQGKKVVSAMSD